ncbi:hypothetical protein BX600DRAFT_415770 [Xylariales sp. PMI_506]|nr:hypothetical protein BX600DRAFT_415770 [Xylariales sp. PMI_506]
MASSPSLSNHDYAVGWICAIPTEYTAACLFLDEKHPAVDVSENDENQYTLGRIGRHNVVILVLPNGEYGVSSASSAATSMLHTFPNIRIGLMVGIGGGAPSEKHDIRLGDIVVGTPQAGHGGVLAYEFGKTIQHQRFQTTAHLNQPPRVLRAAVSGLISQYELRDGHHDLEGIINRALGPNQRLRKKYGRPDLETDRLYRSECTHPSNNDGSCLAICGKSASVLAQRQPRRDDGNSTQIHYGLIASADKLMKDASIRDKLSEERDVLCFEMEAAGLVNCFPCLVIRGICDYADTHKNKEWQGYAAMAAAAYAKELLYLITPTKLEAEKRLLHSVEGKLGDVHTLANNTYVAMERLQADTHTERVQAWLSAPDPSTNFEKARRVCHEGSGQWFLQSTRFFEWKTTKNSFLWLHGIPGCGKTILSSTVIDNLEKSDSHAKTIYFYFDFADSEKQSYAAAVRSLASQLYRKMSLTRPPIDELFFSCESGQRQLSIDSLCTALHKMLEQSGEVWIVLDALDECQERETSSHGLLYFIENLHKYLGNVHLLVTSRPEQDIKSYVSRWARDEDIIHLQNDVVAEDIRAYVKEVIRQADGPLSRWRSEPEIQTEIEGILTEKSDGMFRWVSCQLEVLGTCLGYQDLKNALDDLPTTLDETYARILTTIPSLYRPHAIRMLQFLTFGQRPLRIEETVDAVAVDLAEKPRFDPKNRLPIPEEVARYCSSLVIIVTRQVQGEDKEEQDITVNELQLAHFSVKEYLTSDRLINHMANDLEETTAKSSLTNICLAYLLELRQDLPPKKIRQLYPFAQYSAQYWWNYAQISQRENATTRLLLNTLFAPQGAYTTCCQLYDPEQPSGHTNNKLSTPLYYAASGGLDCSVRMLLDNMVDVNTVSVGYYGTALGAAAAHGHTQIVQILLDAKADVNTVSDSVYGTALTAAADQGHAKIVQILLDAKADVNTVSDSQYSTALTAAACQGHAQIVQILLDAKADVNIVSGGLYGTALGAAAAHGHTQIVQILLDAKADVNTVSDSVYGTALTAAAAHGHTQIVQILLDAKADVNTVSDSQYGTALGAAAYQGHAKIVQILLDAKADVNIVSGGLYGTALTAAACQGHAQIVQILLDAKADVNTVSDNVYGTALTAATSSGHTETVQILLDAKADVNTVSDSVYGTALTAAACQGHAKIVQILLDAKADVNIVSGVRYGTALRAAAYQGHAKIVQMLENASVGVLT